MSEKTQHQETENTSEKWKRRARQLLGTAVLAIVTITGINVLYGADKETHPQETEIIKLDNTERQKIDQAALLQTDRLLYPDVDPLDSRGVDKSEATIENGELIVRADEIVSNMGRGNSTSTISSEMVFATAPTNLDVTSITSFLKSAPHIKHVSLSYSDNFESYNLAINIKNDTLKVTTPKDEGRSVNQPTENFYSESLSDQAISIASGMPDYYSL